MDLALVMKSWNWAELMPGGRIMGSPGLREAELLVAVSAWLGTLSVGCSELLVPFWPLRPLWLLVSMIDEFFSPLRRTTCS